MRRGRFATSTRIEFIKGSPPTVCVSPQLFANLANGEQAQFGCKRTIQIWVTGWVSGDVVRFAISYGRLLTPPDAGNTLLLRMKLFSFTGIEYGRTVLDANLAKDSMDVTLDGLLGYAQFCCDFLICESTAH